MPVRKEEKSGVLKKEDEGCMLWVRKLRRGVGKEHRGALDQLCGIYGEGMLSKYTF